MIRADGAAAGSKLGTLAAALRRAVGDAVAQEAQALRDEARSRCPGGRGNPAREYPRRGNNGGRYG